MQLSQRLETILTMAGTGRIAADIGTDHGYIPIELVRRGYYQQALAMDVRKGPLERAAEHIREAGLSDRIQTRLSDGLAGMELGEADTIIIAGMGGSLMRTLLDTEAEKARNAQKLILSPQTEVGEFHQYILENGFKVEEEVYVEDDNKIYVVMRCIPGQEKEWTEIQMIYGRQPMTENSPVLRKKLEKEIRVAEDLLQKLSNNSGEAAAARIREIQTDLDMARTAYDMMNQ